MRRQALARAAKSYLQLGRLSDARRFCDRALAVNPTNASALADVGCRCIHSINGCVALTYSAVRA